MERSTKKNSFLKSTFTAFLLKVNELHRLLSMVQCPDAVCEGGSCCQVLSCCSDKYGVETTIFWLIEFTRTELGGETWHISSWGQLREGFKAPGVGRDIRGAVSPARSTGSCLTPLVPSWLQLQPCPCARRHWCSQHSPFLGTASWPWSATLHPERGAAWRRASKFSCIASQSEVSDVWESLNTEPVGCVAFGKMIAGSLCDCWLRSRRFPTLQSAECSAVAVQTYTSVY